MTKNLFVVHAAYDDEAGVWSIADAELGLFLEAATFDALRDKLPGAVSDLIEDGRAVAVELVATASVHINIPA
jgi:hypothetical protein